MNLQNLPSQQRYNALCKFLSGLKGPVAVAFSGGIDSTLLLHAASESVSGGVYAFTLLSCFNHPADMEVVSNMSNLKGIEFVTLHWEPLTYPEIVRNDSLRCYYCKFRMYSMLLEECPKKNIKYLMDGTQRDDIYKDRPGMKAILQLGVRTPLADFLLDKQDIRHISLKKSINTWKHSSRSCMATRIKTGVPLRIDDLKLIREIEEIISGINDCCMKITLDEKKVNMLTKTCCYSFANFEEKITKIKKIINHYGRMSLKIQETV